MEFPGRAKLMEHLPDLRSPVLCLRMALIGITSFTIATVAMIAFDHLFPAWTLLGQIGALCVALVVIRQFFRQRTRLKARFGKMAYRHAFLTYVLTGAPVIFAAIAHTAYLPGDRVVTGSLAVVISAVIVYLLTSGVVVWGRAVFAFGADNLAMVYVYFPEEGRIVHSSIYAFIRHPAYSGVLRFGMALGLWHGTWSSLAFALLMPVGMTIWLKLVEEPELIERFGEGYAAYRRAVPAFAPLPRDVGKFWRFLVYGR